MQQILKYFPDLSAQQQAQFRMLQPQYNFWNEKINLISRQDIENLNQHHILHSLAIAKFISFENGTHVLDLGTGGGFPGLPLAILFPDVKFLLIDSIEKKIHVADSISKALALRNVTCETIRAEEVKDQFDFVVSRATADLMILYDWSINRIKRGMSINDVPNGLICLKGGYLDMELAPFKELIYKFNIKDYYTEAWFIDKYIIYLPMD